jgi:hypothetical protein
MNTELTIIEETAIFELVQRQAKLLASSTLVPKEFQGNMSNCAIGLNIAKRLGADPFMVIQNIDIIHGRPSFRATFLIAMVNASGRFTPLQFRMTGDGQTRACTAYCNAKDGGELIEGPEITMAMAKAEGWSTKAGSKWLTMPELMLRYRAAAFFARIYAPDITLGMHTSEESADMPAEPRQVTGRVIPEAALPMPRVNPYAAPEPEPTPAESPEPIAESPVEVSESTERAQLIDSIKHCLMENDSTVAKFAPLCRTAGLLADKVQLIDAQIESLRIIESNSLAILKGEWKP